ncbi:MAG TPA: hypothetical protein VFR63_03460 [Gaiellaceae bacterium]|nr:hypothetical protein [Gaiellaceae bacterium]
MAPSRRSYAVVWRGPDGVAQPGRLTIARNAVRLEGGRGRLSALTVPYADLAAVRMASYGERVGGRPTLVLQRGRGAPVRVAAVGDPGSLAEVLERLTASVPVPEA